MTTKRSNDTVTRYTVHSVLAGAYSRIDDSKAQLTHASQDRRTAVCKRVKEDHLADEVEITGGEQGVTCAVCAKRIALRNLVRA